MCGRAASVISAGISSKNKDKKKKSKPIHTILILTKLPKVSATGTTAILTVWGKRNQIQLQGKNTNENELKRKKTKLGLIKL